MPVALKFIFSVQTSLLNSRHIYDSLFNISIWISNRQLKLICPKLNSQFCPTASHKHIAPTRLPVLSCWQLHPSSCSRQVLVSHLTLTLHIQSFRKSCWLQAIEKTVYSEFSPFSHHFHSYYPDACSIISYLGYPNDLSGLSHSNPASQRAKEILFKCQLCHFISLIQLYSDYPFPFLSHKNQKFIMDLFPTSPPCSTSSNHIGHLAIP